MPPLPMEVGLEHLVCPPGQLLEGADEAPEAAAMALAPAMANTAMVLAYCLSNWYVGSISDLWPATAAAAALVVGVLAGPDPSGLLERLDEDKELLWSEDKTVLIAPNRDCYL